MSKILNRTIFKKCTFCIDTRVRSMMTMAGWIHHTGFDREAVRVWCIHNDNLALAQASELEWQWLVGFSMLCFVFVINNYMMCQLCSNVSTETWRAYITMSTCKPTWYHQQEGINGQRMSNHQDLPSKSLSTDTLILVPVIGRQTMVEKYVHILRDYTTFSDKWCFVCDCIRKWIPCEYIPETLLYASDNVATAGFDCYSHFQFSHHHSVKKEAARPSW